MADFPTTIYAPRTKTNRQGVVYVPAKSDHIFAEDTQKLDAEVVAIETFIKSFFPTADDYFEVTNLSVTGACDIYDLEIVDALYLPAKGLIISFTNTPASSTAQGTMGTVCWDTSYLYICIATNTWKRIALSTW